MPTTPKRDRRPSPPVLLPADGPSDPWKGWGAAGCCILLGEVPEKVLSHPWRHGPQRRISHLELLALPARTLTRPGAGHHSASSGASPSSPKNVFPSERCRVTRAAYSIAERTATAEKCE